MAYKRARPKKPVAKKPAAKKPVKKTAAAMSLHIGLNAVDPKHYDGWSGPLGACEFDADSMMAIAASRKMSSTQLLTTHATRAAVLSGIRAAAKALRSGDFFFLTYSGHGGQVDDVSGDEKDKLDETWCLYDGELIDDELYAELSKFATGVRVLVLSDSCHSGTVTRARITPPPNAKMMPPDIASRVYLKHKAMYDGLQRAVKPASCKAAVVLISGCQDNQTSLDGVKNGAFTEQLLLTWNDGHFKGDYTRFHEKILADMPASQSPNLFQLGPAAKFAAEQVFKV